MIILLCKKQCHAIFRRSLPRTNGDFCQHTNVFWKRRISKHLLLWISQKFQSQVFPIYLPVEHMSLQFSFPHSKRPFPPQFPSHAKAQLTTIYGLSCSNQPLFHAPHPSGNQPPYLLWNHLVRNTAVWKISNLWHLVRCGRQFEVEQGRIKVDEDAEADLHSGITPL